MRRTSPSQAKSSALARLDRALGVGADFLEQAPHDLTVRALRPATDHPARPPDGRARVPIRVEEGGSMGAEVPVALLQPIVVGSSVERERSRRLGLDVVEIALEDVPGGNWAEIDDVMRDGADGGSRLPCRPACPPADVGLGGRAEPSLQPRAEQPARARSGLREGRSRRQPGGGAGTTSKRLLRGRPRTT